MSFIGKVQWAVCPGRLALNTGSPDLSGHHLPVFQIESSRAFCLLGVHTHPTPKHSSTYKAHKQKMSLSWLLMQRTGFRRTHVCGDSPTPRVPGGWPSPSPLQPLSPCHPAQTPVTLVSSLYTHYFYDTESQDFYIKCLPNKV